MALVVGIAIVVGGGGMEGLGEVLDRGLEWIAGERP